jgi:signal peptidase I
LRVVLVTGAVLALTTVAGTLLAIGPRTIRVEGHSMEPTLQDGDRALFVRLRGGPARGEVVAMRYPRNPAKSFVMRVVGLPGERVSIADGIVAIDGRPLDEPYVPSDRRSHEAFGPLRLGPDEYFMLADNRRNASDSREWGPVARRLIWARFHAIWWRR